MYMVFGKTSSENCTFYRNFMMASAFGIGL